MPESANRQWLRLANHQIEQSVASEASYAAKGNSGFAESGLNLLKGLRLTVSNWPEHDLPKGEYEVVQNDAKHLKRIEIFWRKKWPKNDPNEDLSFF